MPTSIYGTGATVTSGAKRTYHEFRSNVITSKLLGGAATGTGGDTDLMQSGADSFTAGCLFEYHIKGTQTILAPVLTAVGLDIGMDQTNNDGVEITQGITARSPMAFVVGADQGFSFAVRVKLEDASGVDPLYIGFRKAEAYQADHNDYAEAALIGVEGTADPNTIKTSTIIGSAANVVTDTTQTWADAATKTLKVKVSAAGVVTYEIDGLPPPVVAAYTFAPGTVVVPCVYFLNGADVAGKVELISWDCGWS